MGKGETSVAPFQARFYELRDQGVSSGDMCRRLGWVDGHGQPEVSRLTRTLGIREWWGQPEGYRTRAVTRDIAARLCVALDLVPVEVGL